MAALQARTLFQSFQLPLPNFPSPSGPASASISGDSTAMTDPPKFATAAANDYQQNGIAFTTNAQTPRVQAALNRDYLPGTEQSTYHANEGDVVRSAALYLLHPVNMALCAHPQVGVRCQSEMTVNRIRSDITYYRVPVQAGGEYRTFAIIEFKKRGVIKPSQFRAAVKTVNAATPAQTHIAAATGRRGNTFFRANSGILMKQASSYAIRHRTQYVGLFNWDALVLVRFVQLDPNQSTPTLAANGVGDQCEIEIIPLNQSNRMRAALLGFLVDAYHNTP